MSSASRSGPIPGYNIYRNWRLHPGKYPRSWFMLDGLALWKCNSLMRSAMNFLSLIARPQLEAFWAVSAMGQKIIQRSPCGVPQDNFCQIASGRNRNAIKLKGVHILLSNSQSGPGRKVSERRKKFLATTYHPFSRSLYKACNLRNTQETLF